MTVHQAHTVCQEKVSSPVQQATTVLVAGLRAFCRAHLAPTALSSVSVRWSSASFVQQVRALFHSCPLLDKMGS